MKVIDHRLAKRGPVTAWFNSNLELIKAQVAGRPIKRNGVLWRTIERRASLYRYERNR